MSPELKAAYEKLTTEEERRDFVYEHIKDVVNEKVLKTLKSQYDDVLQFKIAELEASL